MAIDAELAASLERTRTLLDEAQQRLQAVRARPRLPAPTVAADGTTIDLGLDDVAGLALVLADDGWVVTRTGGTYEARRGPDRCSATTPRGLVVAVDERMRADGTFAG